MPFDDLGLCPELVQAVKAKGYDTPTPIQAQAIPSVLMMRDLIAIAQTGTGKTASFVLPMIDILAHGRRRAAPRTVPAPLPASVCPMVRLLSPLRLRVVLSAQAAPRASWTFPARRICDDPSSTRTLVHWTLPRVAISRIPRSSPAKF